jgi:hypothetical protein
MANLADTTDPSGHLIAANQVQGTMVYNAKLEKLGSVEDVMIDKVSGRQILSTTLGKAQLQHRTRRLRRRCRPGNAGGCSVLLRRGHRVMARRGLGQGHSCALRRGSVLGRDALNLAACRLTCLESPVT